MAGCSTPRPLSRDGRRADCWRPATLPSAVATTSYGDIPPTSIPHATGRIRAAVTRRRDRRLSRGHHALPRRRAAGDEHGNSQPGQPDEPVPRNLRPDGRGVVRAGNRRTASGPRHARCHAHVGGGVSAVPAQRGRTSLFGSRNCRCGQDGRCLCQLRHLPAATVPGTTAVGRYSATMQITVS